MITNIVTDKNLAWDVASIASKDAFTYHLSEETLEEIKLHEKELVPVSADLAESSESMLSFFPHLAKEFATIQQLYLESGFGFCIVTGLDICHLSEQSQRYFFSIVGHLLGTPLVQNAKDEKLVDVRDMGHSMKTGGRYHFTKEGGDLHTDSPQYENPPDYLGLLCVRPAMQGGESKLVSAYSIHNDLLQHHPDLLEILYQPFHFDKKGDFKPGESPTTFKPVFTDENGVLSFRYLRNYIDQGHATAGVPLTDKQLQALAAVDALLNDDPSLVVLAKLEAGDILFNSNNRIVHGRTGFEDFEDEEKKRLMIRLWIRKN